MYDKIVIGFDQSYTNTGIAIAADGQLKHITHADLSQFRCKSEKRDYLMGRAAKACSICIPRAAVVLVVMERIRLFSRGVISQAYIQSMGALNAVIIDVCASYGVPVYSVDTRAWKAAVVGTTKKEENDFGVPPEKWPCVRWVIGQGFEASILRPIAGRRTKGTFVVDGSRYAYDNDAADAAGIAMAGFLCPDKLKLEE